MPPALVLPTMTKGPLMSPFAPRRRRLSRSEKRQSRPVNDYLRRDYWQAALWGVTGTGFVVSEVENVPFSTASPDACRGGKRKMKGGRISPPLSLIAAIIVGLIIACAGCAADRGARPPAAATQAVLPPPSALPLPSPSALPPASPPRSALLPPTALPSSLQPQSNAPVACNQPGLAASAPIVEGVALGNHSTASAWPQSDGPVVPVQYAAPQESSKPVETRPPEAVPAPSASPVRLSVNEAIRATLMADPKIRAGFEAIHQSNAEWLTASLPPNPSLIVQGQYLPLQAFTPATPGGPTEFDVQVAYPVDWFLFGKRAAAMASAGLGVRQSEADYADLVRQRVSATATAYYDVVEAKGLLGLARDDTDNLARLEAATKRAVDAGGRPPVDLHRVRLDLLKSQQDLREADSCAGGRQGETAGANGLHRPRPGFRRGWQSRRALDGATVARGRGVCPGAGRTGRTFNLCEIRSPRPRPTSWSSSERHIRSSRPNSATPGKTRRSLVSRMPMPGTPSSRRPCPLFDRNQGNRAQGPIRRHARLLQPPIRIGRSPGRDRRGGPGPEHGLQERHVGRRGTVEIGGRRPRQHRQGIPCRRAAVDRRARRRAHLPRHLPPLHLQPCRLLAGRLQVQLGHWKTDYTIICGNR